ncbi:hypothetical protein KQI49_04880 [Virgibacillus sp. MSJ-26]|nr:hypothetical protein [Virgibacillus sp. MSJ-26]
MEELSVKETAAILNCIDWYNNYNYSIFKYILNMINDYQQAEDLTQETFIKVYN